MSHSGCQRQMVVNLRAQTFRGLFKLTQNLLRSTPLRVWFIRKLRIIISQNKRHRKKKKFCNLFDLNKFRFPLRLIS